MDTTNNSEEFKINVFRCSPCKLRIFPLHSDFAAYAG